jgi:pimeloyl-ACP methyl ester carboxylesterase
MSEQKLFFRKLGQGKPLIILHGLFGSSDNWMSVAKVLAENFEVYVIDQRNHGQSFHAPEHNFDVMANDLAQFVSENGIVAPIIMGHSMGGKVAMRYVLDNPDKVEKLVVVDISPRGYKVHHDQILEGLKSIRIDSISSRKEADEQLAAFVPELGVRQFLLKSLDRTANGFKWLINVKAIDKNIGHIVGEIEGGPSPVNTLFIKGETSRYIRDLDLPMIEKLFPHSEVVTIQQAGHWVHAEQPEEFIETVTSFLNK